MPLDPSLVGHETQAEISTITVEDVRAFAEAVGDTNPVFRDPAAAQLAGFPNIPALPTFVTRFRVPFAEAGLDPEHTQVLHGEQEYEYTRPVCAGDTLSVRHRVASIRQSARAGGMAVMTIEQIGETLDGERAVTGRATIIVRDAPPDAAAAAPGGSGARARTPEGEAIPTLTKYVTQEQINAYANVSGDHNPVHINPEVARAVGLDGTIAHGMLSMAFAGQMLTDWATAQSGHAGWVSRLRVRFQAMVRPGDTLTCHGVLCASGSENGRERLDVWTDNQQGERVLTGDADVVLSGAEAGG
ncbi:MAG TPA: MaoC family dehydratase N-terminal domain-containing protein [Ktedonobacterales bacterium]|nr:MaoC family dehydratase N-terminal domain-containing protein [Ktedonobacterales bacterium]